MYCFQLDYCASLKNLDCLKVKPNYKFIQVIYKMSKMSPYIFISLCQFMLTSELKCEMLYICSIFDISSFCVAVLFVHQLFIYMHQLLYICSSTALYYFVHHELLYICASTALYLCISCSIFVHQLLYIHASTALYFFIIRCSMFVHQLLYICYQND